MATELPSQVPWDSEYYSDACVKREGIVEPLLERQATSIGMDAVRQGKVCEYEQ